MTARKEAKSRKSGRGMSRITRSAAFCVAVTVSGALLVLSAILPAVAAARWGGNGIKVCGAQGDDTAARVIPDGAGGAIIVWLDGRHDPSGANPWIYAQRVDPSGRTLWQAEGVPVCGAEQIEWPGVVSDGRGGAIITWGDAREWPKWQVFAQRVDSAGNVMWAADGITICNESGYGDVEWPRPQPAADGGGGAIIVWPDFRRGVPDMPDIYAQRVNASGNTLWTDNGLLVSPLPDNHTSPIVCPDGAGGAIVSFTGPNLSQLAQRVDGSGNHLWPEAGVQVLGPRPVETLTQDMSMVPDGLGGALFSWSEDRTYHEQCYDIYCQRVDGAGQVLWTADGVTVSVVEQEDGIQPSAESVADGGGGMIITWIDSREGDRNRVWAQRVDARGRALWTQNGRRVAGGGTYKALPTIASDGLGGGIVNWLSKNPDDSWHLYVQRVSGAGGLVWGAAGARPCMTPVSYDYCPMATDTTGGAILSWGDLRADDQSDIYAQRVSNPAPVVGSVSPASGSGDQKAWAVKIAGSHFFPGVKVRLRKTGWNDIPASRVTFRDEGGVSCTFDLSGAAAGEWTVAVTNPDGQSGSLARGFQVTGNPTCYLAEGTNAWGFSTYITVMNPNNSAVDAKLTCMDTNPPAKGKGIVTERTIALPANSQTTVSSMADIGEVDFSTRVECLQGKTIAADRTMFWTGELYEPSQAGYHSSIGATAPSKVWYLAEGSSNWGLETWTLIENPNAAPADLTLTYMTPDGPARVSKVVPPRSRATYSMLSDIGEADASVMVTSSVPVVAERSMYRNSRREGSCSIGATVPSTDYFLAEGATGYDVGFKAYVLIQNPNEAENRVALTFQTGAGVVEGPAFSMLPNSRITVCLNDHLPENTDVSTMVHGTRPLVAERAMYWDNGTGEAFHASVGLPGAHMSFYLPDGQTSKGFETWTLVANPNPGAVRVRVTYLPQGGGKTVSFTDEIAPGTRATYDMAEKMGADARASILVESLDGARPVIAERSMYTNNRGAGTDTVGNYTD